MGHPTKLGGTPHWSESNAGASSRWAAPASICWPIGRPRPTPSTWSRRRGAGSGNAGGLICAGSVDSPQRIADSEGRGLRCLHHRLGRLRRLVLAAQGPADQPASGHPRGLLRGARSPCRAVSFATRHARESCAASAGRPGEDALAACCTSCPPSPGMTRRAPQNISRYSLRSQSVMWLRKRASSWRFTARKQLQEIRPQHLAEHRIGAEIGQRLFQAARQFHMGGIVLARPLGLRPAASACSGCRAGPRPACRPPRDRDWPGPKPRASRDGSRNPSSPWCAPGPNGPRCPS